MKKLCKLVFHTLTNLMTGWIFVVKMILFNTLIKSIAMLVGSALIIMYFVNPDLLSVIKYIVPMIYLIGCLLSAVKLAFSEERKAFYSFHSTSTDAENADSPATGITDTLFSGMSKEAATKEYKRLLKIYHPDNPNTGDSAVAQMIIEKYQTMFA